MKPREMHALLMAEANHLGLPLYYKDDLLKHDLDTLVARNPTDFAWSIREHGTHLIVVDTLTDLEWGLAVAGQDKDHAKYYVFESNNLRSVSCEAWKAWLAAEAGELPEWRVTYETSYRYSRPDRTAMTISARDMTAAREIAAYKLERCRLPDSEVKIIAMDRQEKAVA